MSGIETRVVDAVLAHWNQRHLPMLISQLGSSLTADDRAALRGEDTKLSEFVRLRLPDNIRIIDFRHLPHGDVAVVPAQLDLGATDDELVRRLRETRSDSGGIRFKPAVWAAFIQTLSEEQPFRLLSIPSFDRNTRITFRMSDNSDERLSTEYIIGRDHLPLFSPSDTKAAQSEAVDQAIRKWADENSIPLEVLILDRTEMRRKSEQAEGLAERVASLSTADLSRIMVPLDIVLKLVSTGRS